ncbi:MAG: M20/M25/M40 family metallo-hydrolase [Deltaproteobacteria bacterium]|nr:M20/M25/M40 family metallo-hydrolase [Deltaproteobacteria bacterium]
MEHEAVELLSKYLRVDTSNPPGNEDRAVGFFADILDAEGVIYKIYEPRPGRASLRAVLPGTGEAGPLILLNHTDVVPARAEEWSFDPFGGVVEGGYVKGRGALDMKGQGIMELLALLDIKRRGIRPVRDIVFLAVADEEAGSRWGVEYLLEHHPEDFQADLVLNEGGFGLKNLLPEQTVMMVSTAEKGVCWLRLTREGPPGHGSLPHGRNTLEKLVQALSRLLSEDQPVRITPVVERYFKGLGRGWDFLGPFLEEGNPETLARILEENGLMAMPQVSALARNTISLTTLQAGIRTNVIPSRAEAHLDVRLLPGQRIEDVVEDVRRRLGDEQVEVVCETGTESTESPWDGEYFSRIQNVLEAGFPGSVVVPSLMFAASDSRFFRQRGIPSYGVCPVLLDLEDVEMVHGIDEKIAVDELLKGTEVFTAIVEEFCAH